LRIVYDQLTDPGKVRESNEDFCLASGKLKLFLVADGMGGHAAGEVASRIAGTKVEELVARAGGAEQDPADLLRRAALSANTEVYEEQLANPEFGGMGSTLTVLTFRGGNYYIGHVGDSRAYLLRGDVLQQLTRDHSLVWHLYETGLARKEDLSRHPQKNLITRSIGPHPQVEVELACDSTANGDTFLLCSDGLTDVLTDNVIHAILSDTAKHPKALCEDLVNAANSGRDGGRDNITVVVVRLESDGDAPVEDTPR
jgi:PPM family protein phosphatase